MNRFKLVLILIVLGLFGILLAQNRQILFLKFFCPDIAEQNCLYQTPALPLGIWMLIFAIAGVISSSIWQFLIQVNPNSSAKRRSSQNYSDTFKKPDKQFTRSQAEYTRPKAEVKTTNNPASDWEKTNSEDWLIDETKPSIKEEVKYEVNSKPSESQSTIPSDSVYSYKYREASPKNKENTAGKTANKTDDVYDASYRTINNTQPSKPSNIDDDDEEWI